MNSIPLAGQVAAPTPLYMWNQRLLHSPALLELLPLLACSLHSDVELCRLCFGHGSHGMETALLRRGQHRAWPTHLALRTSFLSLNGHVMLNCLTVIHQRTLMLSTIIDYSSFAFVCCHVGKSDLAFVIWHWGNDADSSRVLSSKTLETNATPCFKCWILIL